MSFIMGPTFLSLCTLYQQGHQDSHSNIKHNISQQITIACRFGSNICLNIIHLISNRAQNVKSLISFGYHFLFCIYYMILNMYIFKEIIHELVKYSIYLVTFFTFSKQRFPNQLLRYFVLHSRVFVSCIYLTIHCRSLQAFLCSYSNNKALYSCH